MASSDRKVPINYSLISRGDVVLCDYIARNEGDVHNFSREALRKSSRERTTTVTKGNQMAHVLRDSDFCFLCITAVVEGDVYFGTIFNFLSKMKSSFESMGMRQKALNAGPYSLRTEFAFTLKTLMEESMYGDSAIRRMSGKADSVRENLSQNLAKLQERESKLDELSESTSLLLSGSQEFNRRSAQLRRKNWCQRFRIHICIASVVIIILVILCSVGIAVGIIVSRNSSNQS